MSSSMGPRTGGQQPGRGRLGDTLLEVAGIVCIAGFFWFVWPPAPLAVVGAYLFVGGNLRSARPGGTGPTAGERLARAAGAFANAYRSSGP